MASSGRAILTVRDFNSASSLVLETPILGTEKLTGGREAQPKEKRSTRVKGTNLPKLFLIIQTLIFDRDYIFNQFFYLKEILVSPYQPFPELVKTE